MILLVSQNWIDWENFLKVSNELLRRSITRKMDETRIEYKNLDGYLAALGSFSSFKYDPKQSQGDANLLGFVSLTFLIQNPDVKQLTRLGRILYLASSNDECVLCSGTLDAWKEILIFLSKKKVAQELIKELVLEFERINLGSLWRKKITSTGDFIILHHD